MKQQISHGSFIREFVKNLAAADLESNAAIDARTAERVQPHDAHLAGLIRNLVDAKIAIGRYLKSRVEG